MSPSRPPGHDAPDFSRVTGGVRSVAEDDAQAGAPAPVRTHVVRKGDTLSTIAEQVYGRASRWQAIYAANRDVLDDPDRIQPGQVLQLPAD
ncbi:LysM peptidoglycan-binding domain-containing protein [Luteimonas sp. TWI1416]|uniref:LysM peptidoglycan-binding domain-containing protein n=1 Tax=unclassified Luteimonas TaxID=2629088 RepID=UPI003207E8B0